MHIPAKADVGSPDHHVTLTRRDIIVFEQRLKQTLYSLFPFQGYSIHFPRTADPLEAAKRPDEDKLLLPLPDLASSDTDGRPRTLGVFTARGVPAKNADALLPQWPALGKLIAENLLLYKQSLCDPITGLFSRHYLLARMERELDGLRLNLPAGGAEKAADSEKKVFAARAMNASEDELPSGGSAAGRVGLAALVIRFAALRDVAREFGYRFADELVRALADALTPVCPESALAARIGDAEFAVHLSSTSPTECRKAASNIGAALRSVFLTHPLRNERVGLMPSVGFSLYPQDMGGDMFLRPPADQARLLLRNARLAAARAGESSASFAPGRQAEGQAGPRTDQSIMAFSRILAEGGRVLEALPLSRVIVGLGEKMHAREGLRFSVWSFQSGREGQGKGKPRETPIYKGEIVLMDVRENTSQAEVLCLGDPAWEIEPGDRLLLLPEEQNGRATAGDDQERRDPGTGFLRHGDFFARWAEERERTEAFTLALLRLGDPVPENGKEPMRPEQLMPQAAECCREAFGVAVLGGRYGLNSLILFHPAATPEQLLPAYEQLCTLFRQRFSVEAAAGLAGHPYLDFRKADAPENCRKALEYALLLPSPHVGILDTLAINISADKRFSQGDTFGAVKEYQSALLADATNGMAWNSLGICLAGLGRHGEAEAHFTEALRCDATDAMALYNLGYIYQSQGRDAEARKRYEECLQFDPQHLFAHIRLGRLAETGGNANEARAFYEKAAALPGGESLTFRHFARLALNEGKEDEARECLHEALLHDPQDAQALQLLARLYLDSGEDPDMAASLARQSVSLRPDLKAGWLELARALTCMGKDAQAKEARLRAGEM